MRQPKDWGQPCRNPASPHDRRMQPGNVRAIAPYLTQSGTRRIFRCRTCATHLAETRETVFFDLRPSEEQVMMALTMLLVRVDLTGLSFVLGVTAATGWAWLRRAAQQAEEINRPLLRDLPVTQGQRDERWNFIERQHARETDAAGESWPSSEDGRQWGWGSFAPECRLMIAAIVGPRTLDTAKDGVVATKARVAGIPAFFSDGFPCYLAALIAAFPLVPTFARTGKRGRPRQPVCAPPPELIDGQGVKQQKPGKLLTLSPRVVLGAERLTHLRLTISTALVERVNLTLRQALAPWARKTSSFCKDRERMRQRVVFLPAFYKVARPPRSLRQPLPRHARTRQGAICPRWRERTPGMVAGLTDHGWTFRELLTATFAP